MNYLEDISSIDMSELQFIARQIRGQIVEMSHRTGGAHVGSSLSCVDILVAAYWGALTVDPQNPGDPGRDRLILSKGHAASALYAAAYSRSMGRILAIETGDEVIISAVQPGIIFTERGHWAEVMKTRPEHAKKYLRERTVLGRFGKPSEISPMVISLCSNLATFCQGAIVPVDGGQARHYFNIQGV